jgi:hypothetical protein
LFLERFTPKAFAKFQPSVGAKRLRWEIGAMRSEFTPKVLANALGVMKQSFRAPQGRNPGLKLANTFGVISTLRTLRRRE